MRKLTLIVLGFIFCTLAGAAEVAGVKLEDKISLSGTDLVLNGAGIRSKAFFKVYVGALYVAQKQTALPGVLAQKTPRRVQMTLLRDLTADQLVDALVDGLGDNHSKAEMDGMKAQVEQLANIMRSMKEVKTGAVVTIDFVPGTGTVVALNGASKGTIGSDAFNGALMKVWLGEHPVSDSLKKAMLGG
ncbi:MAG: chalcone isomerase family protein [Betaproteobacteria bacterium]|nr:chalcone isomerase family protein [Betaproteobacteria bacterium]